MHRLACWRLCYCDISAACSVLFALLIALSPLVAGVDLEEVAAFLFANLFLTLGIGMAEEIFFRGISCNLWLKYGVIKAMPLVEKPKKYAEYAGSPAFLCNNYAMFLLSPMFEPIMGMEPATIYSMVPVNDRKDGVVLDASITNPDMARNFGEYRYCRCEPGHSNNRCWINYREYTN